MSCFSVALRAVSSPGFVSIGGAARRPPRGAEGLAALMDATSNRGEAGVCAVSPATIKPARAAASAVASHRPRVLIFPAKIPWYRFLRYGTPANAPLRSRLGMRLLAREGHRPFQLGHFLHGQMAELARLQRPQVDGSNLDAPQLLHQPAEMFEHHADLVIAPFHQTHFIPGVLRVADQFEARRHGAPAG